MGKIFDALQKAQKSKPGEPETLPSGTSQKVEPLEALKVVSSGEKVGLTQAEPGYKIPSTTKAGLSENLYLLLNAQDQPEVLEQYRLLRSSIFSAKQDGQRPKCIMVTSPVSKEGKSTVACNLAISIALGIHERVILIDADMRRPSQHKFLGTSYKFGLADYLLRDDVGFKDIIYPTLIDKLYLVPSGSADPHMATELLASNKMRALITETKSKHTDQYVVIDTPPCALTSDPGVLAESADTILLVIANGVSTNEQISDALKTLGKEKICGIVFNCCDYHMGLKKYYYQYKQYYGKR